MEKPTIELPLEWDDANRDHAQRPFEQMTEEEEAEYFYANREEFERNAKTPISLERVVSTRFTEAELAKIGEAASAAGMKLSTFIRQAAVEAAGVPQAAPDIAGLAQLHAELSVALAHVKDMEMDASRRARTGGRRRRGLVSSDTPK
jgi:predicted DNA binding CopG/RHH family protein